MELMVSLNQDGATVILITHDPEVAEMCARQITLKDGRIEFDSSTMPGNAHD